MDFEFDTNTITLNEGNPTIECQAEIEVIEDISVMVKLYAFADQNAVREIFEFVEKTCNDLVDDTLTSFPRVQFRVSGTVNMVNQNGETIDRVSITSTPVFLYRHRVHREEAIYKQLLRISNPQHYRENYGNVELDGDTSGSSFAAPTEIRTITISLIFPQGYNPRALPTSARLNAKQSFSRHITFMPYNSDKYCFFHCIYEWLHPDQPKVEKFRSLNANDLYINAFNKWAVENKIEEFYYQDFFLVDLIPKIEERLKMSINVYQQSEDGGVELYYRSEYKYGYENPLNIVIIPLSSFTNERTRKVIATDCETIEPVKYENKFLTKMSTKEFSSTKAAHAAILSKNFFLNKSGRSVCRYCNITKRETEGENYAHSFALHESNCRQQHQGVPAGDRTRNYVESKNPEKIFDRYSSFYRTPFCTFDWETRIEETVVDKIVRKKHVPYSFSILYFNVFQPEKSKIVLERSNDSVELVKKFVEECKKLTVYHHDTIQSVDMAVNKPALTDEVRAAGCPFCLKQYDSEKRQPEYNHSHFLDDNLNLQYNKYICSDCNKKAMVRNKPLKFYAHNGSKYDNNLFMPTFLNDPKVLQHSFLNKTESRFTEVKLGFKVVDSDVTRDMYGNENCKYKLSFNDSMMLLPGPLAKLCSAWINKAKDEPLLGKLMKIYYKNIKNVEPKYRETGHSAVTDPCYFR